MNQNLLLSYQKSLFYKLVRKAYFSFYLSPGWIMQKIKKFLKNPRREIEKIWQVLHVLQVFLRTRRIRE